MILKSEMFWLFTDAIINAFNIVGTEDAGWFGFQPLYDRLKKEFPDLNV